ncbi:hypothetical protein Poli38472_010461 [Pythium oligandrum]|uniref:Uncharacterized protein n=1 Tax=Pythium oligandrum TaxID=41045 RepID=A0A8K1C372_PYTOL|nr:hypothetical protein Poli38472_010461 [Pythium oligandrum]|eukprot:TMW55579.1 hypothetical protein Poli38472_010461 [Pythium oligandrum]
MTERKPWDGDAAVRHGKTSLDVLLAWLQQEGNYTRWRGESTTVRRESREELCREIVLGMQRHGLFHRQPRHVRTKINELERSYGNAIGWMDQAGTLLMDDEGGPEYVRSRLHRMCKHFSLLHAVMGESVPLQVSTEPDMGEGFPPCPADGNRSVVSPMTDDSAHEAADARVDDNNAAMTEDSTPDPTATKKRKACTLAEWIDVDLFDDTPLLTLAERKFKLEERHATLEAELLKWQVVQARVESVKKLVLTRVELRQAGVSEAEIDALLPVLRF